MMPAEVEKMFDGMQQDVWHLHIKVKMYFQIFQRSELQNELLKRAANLFFNHLEHSLFSDILLNVARLNDPSKTRVGGQDRKNWTLEFLKLSVEKDTEISGNKLDLTELYKDIEVTRKFFKDTRDRFLAHRDWDRRDDPIVIVARPHLEIILERYSNFLNAIEKHYNQSVTDYHPVDTLMKGDGEKLIRCLVEWAKSSGEPNPEWCSSWEQVF